MKAINLIPVNPNIARVYEIAKSGGHTMRIISENHRERHEDDIKLLNEFYEVAPVEKPDMYVRFYTPSPDHILNAFTHKWAETKEHIDERINAFHQNVDFDDTLQGGAKAILKTAIEKLNLGINDTLTILKVAKTIALMEGAKHYEAQHVAEAINYSIKAIN